MKKTSKAPDKSLEINLPVVKTPMKPPSVRTMDEIIMWIEQDYELFFDRTEYEKRKLAQSVYKRFEC
jgi:hypothetical protein